MVRRWIYACRDERFQTKATTYLTKHLKSKLVRTDTPIVIQHPFHTLSNVGLSYSYKGTTLNSLSQELCLGLSRELILKHLVQVERAALRGGKNALLIFLVDPSEIIRNYAKSRYEELKK